MPLSNLIVYIAVAVVIVVFIAFPSFREKFMCLLSGFLNVFIEDTAKTPEGAEAIYNQAIEEKQEAYVNADNVYKRLSGKLSGVKSDYENTNKKISDAETKARAAMQRGDEHTARIYAEQRQDLITVAKQQEDMISQLSPAVSQAKEIFLQREKELKEIKRKKIEVVEQMKFNRDIENSYNDLDELRQDTATKKLLGAIDEECKDGKDRANGAKIVHESKLSTRANRADRKASSYEVDDFLSSLKTNNSSYDKKTNTNFKVK